MDDDERDPNLVAEMVNERLARARERERARAWDDPPCDDLNEE